MTYLTRWRKSWLALALGALLWTIPASATATEQEVLVETEGAIAKAPQAEKPGGIVGWLELSDELHEGPPRFAWDQQVEYEHSMSGVLEKLHHVADNEEYVGLVIYLDEPVLEFTQIDEITAAIKDVRDSGKKVFAFSEGYDLSSYLLACATDGIILQRKGEIQIAGLGLEEMYLKGLLEKIGVQADMLQIGEFKGAADPLTRAGPSAEWSQNMDALLDDLYEQVLTRIGEARGLTRAQVEQVFADCWTLTNEQYVQRKLVDHLADRDLTEVTGKAFGNEFVWDAELGAEQAMPAMDNPFVMLRMLFQPQEQAITRPTIAVIHARGPITGGESSDGGAFGGQTIGSRTIVQALRDTRDDNMIKGVILRVDSPGGSANASEVIWQAVRDVSAHKPVFVSVGSMAASGGYYIACAGDRIYTEPNAILGSIGVVGGKMVLGQLYEKVGLTVHRRSRGPSADVFNSVEPFTAEQRALLQTVFQRTYDLFIDRVKTGRGEHLNDPDTVARGRLFTGHQAVQNGLADNLGGLEDSITDLAVQLGLPEGSYDVIDLPAPRTFAEVLDELIMAAAPTAPTSSGSQAALLQSARQILGPRAWNQVRSVTAGLLLLQREPVLTLLPAVIVVK